MSPHFSIWVQRLRQRVFLGEVLHVAANWLGLFCIAWGLCVLAVKLFHPAWWPNVLWCGLAVVPVAATAVWLAWRRMPADRDMVALLDRRLNAGGLLMMLSERPEADWTTRLPQNERLWSAALPHFRPVRFVKTLAIPALFLLAAGFIPARALPTPPPATTVGTDAAKELAEALETLEEANVLEEEEKQTLEQEIEKLETASEQAPLTHEKWEMIDALREQMQSSFERTVMNVQQGLSASAALSGEGLNEMPLSLERTEQLTKDLQKALQSLQKTGAFSSEALQSSEALKKLAGQLAATGQLKLPGDAAARAATLGELKKLLEAEAQRLGECRGKCEGGLCRGLKPGNGTVIMASELPGKGGVTRGRGDAEMTYGQESDEQSVKFKETVLPPGYLDQPNDSVLGVMARMPEVAPERGDEAGAARTQQAAAGKTTWQRPLRPRHRDVVREYFQE